jgi:hypothetical protein
MVDAEMPFTLKGGKKDFLVHGKRLCRHQYVQGSKDETPSPPHPPSKTLPHRRARAAHASSRAQRQRSKGIKMTERRVRRQRRRRVCSHLGDDVARAQDSSGGAAAHDFHLAHV